MAEPKKFQFDVWLTHANTVYRGVPYEVVTDWIQQGRLLEDDRIRPVGTEEWFVLAKVPAFSGYLPKHETLRTDQHAEALEPVESGFVWGHKGEDEDADPDMIPLIDVSLVLLIFFMMTSQVASAISSIRVPEVVTQEQLVEADRPRTVWIGIDYPSMDQPPAYTFRVDLEELKESNASMNEEQVLNKLKDIASKYKIPEVRLAAHRQLSFDLVRHMAVELEKLKNEGKITVIRVEVGEKKGE
jgi:biopolymer transport protein ExbD